jgi:hypothetical protein
VVEIGQVCTEQLGGWRERLTRWRRRRVASLLHMRAAMLRAATVVALFSLTACLTELESETSTTESELGTVVEDPAPYVACKSGCTSPHFVGEPIEIATSFSGVCELLRVQYLCNSQPYTLTFQCNGAPCQVGPTWQTSPETSVTRITPTAAGPLSIEVHFASNYDAPRDTFTIPTITSIAVDRLEVDCVAGPSQAPCTSGLNPAPVTLRFSLWSGSTEVFPAQKVSVYSSTVGQLASTGRSWTTSRPGITKVDVSWGTFSITRSFEIPYVRTDHRPRGLGLWTDSRLDGPAHLIGNGSR